MNKKYLVFGALALTAFTAMGAKKGYDISTVAGALETSLRTIRRMNFTATGIQMQLDIAITNPTDKSLDVSTGGVVKIKTINIYNKKGALVATANPNISGISIVPGGTVILERVPVESRYGDIVNTLIGGASSNPDDYIVETVIESFGKTFTI